MSQTFNLWHKRAFSECSMAYLILFPLSYHIFITLFVYDFSNFNLKPANFISCHELNEQNEIGDDDCEEYEEENEVP